MERWSAPTDVAELTLDGSTKTGIGFNVGLLASPTENLSIGISYRHKVSMDHAAQAIPTLAMIAWPLARPSMPSMKL